MYRVLIALALFPTLAMAERTCPSSFNEFLSLFEQSQKFQLENINYPLKYSFIDASASPAPKTINKLQSKLDITKRNNPIYPSIPVQENTPLLKNIHIQSQNQKIVQLHKPDTDYNTKYHFKKIGECWKLVMFESFSL